jgi:hypothetical protein
MNLVPSREARLAVATTYADLWNAGKEDEWLAAWRSITPGEVRFFDPVGTEEKIGFDTAFTENWGRFQSLLKLRVLNVQLNGNEMALFVENKFGTEPNVQTGYSIETYAWDETGDLLFKSYYSMPEDVGPGDDPYAHLLEKQ